MPVLGLLIYFIPTSLTEFIIHCEVNIYCLLEGQNNEWSTMCCWFCFFSCMIKCRKFQQDPWNYSGSDSFSAIPTRNCYTSKILLAFQDNWAVYPVLCSNSCAYLKCFSQLWEDVAIDRSYKRIKVLDNSS